MVNKSPALGGKPTSNRPATRERIQLQSSTTKDKRCLKFGIESESRFHSRVIIAEKSFRRLVSEATGELNYEMVGMRYVGECRLWPEYKCKPFRAGVERLQ